MAKKTSINRLQARDAEKKILPAIKMLSKYMHNTTSDVPLKNFHGYELCAGHFMDHSGRKVQLQIRAIYSKGKYVKEGEIHPIIRKWALFFKLRLFVKAFIDKIFTD
jgi:hypothetical protein